MVKCPHCEEADKFAVRPVNNTIGEKLANALVCIHCDKIIHIFDAQFVSNYGPILEQILTELQAISDKVNA